MMVLSTRIRLLPGHTHFRLRGSEIIIRLVLVLFQSSRLPLIWDMSIKSGLILPGRLPQMKIVQPQQYRMAWFRCVSTIKSVTIKSGHDYREVSFISGVQIRGTQHCNHSNHSTHLPPLPLLLRHSPVYCPESVR